jgi:hypothetical protein
MNTPFNFVSGFKDTVSGAGKVFGGTIGVAFGFHARLQKPLSLTGDKLIDAGADLLEQGMKDIQQGFKVMTGTLQR